MTKDFLAALKEHANAHGDVIAVDCEGISIDYRTLELRSDSFANALQGDGIPAGSRVAFLAKSCIEFFEYLVGSIKAGVVPVPLNWRLANAEIEAIIDDAEVVLLIVGDEFSGRAEAMKDQMPKVRRIVSLERHEIFLNWTDWLNDYASEAQSSVQIANDTIIMQMYTSGTTGTPKGAMTANAGFSVYLEKLSSVVNLALGSVSLSTLPLFHIGGAGWVCAALYRGATVLILREVNPDVILQTISSRKVSHVIAVPTVVQMLLQSPTVASTDFSSLRYLYYGAGPMTEYILGKALDAFHCNFVQGYGLTECPLICALEPKDHARSQDLLRSCGRPVAGTTVRIVNPATGEDVTPGEIGEIWVKSPLVFAGYWKQPEVTSTTLVDGIWLRTGDGAYANPDGFLFMKDRLKDMIITGGENVYSIEVESVLISYPGVAECAVIGVPSEKWVETVKAIIVRAPGSTLNEEQLLNHCRSLLARFKCPTSIAFVESLPKTLSGKVLKYVLRENFANKASG